MTIQVKKINYGKLSIIIAGWKFNNLVGYKS